LPNSKQTGSVPPSAASAFAMSPVSHWNYSPHPLVEETLNRIRQT
jgi:hypothetical protein